MKVQLFSLLLKNLDGQRTYQNLTKSEVIRLVFRARLNNNLTDWTVSPMPKLGRPVSRWG